MSVVAFLGVFCGSATLVKAFEGGEVDSLLGGSSDGASGLDLFHFWT